MSRRSASHLPSAASTPSTEPSTLQEQLARLQERHRQLSTIVAQPHTAPVGSVSTPQPFQPASAERIAALEKELEEVTQEKNSLEAQLVTTHTSYQEQLEHLLHEREQLRSHQRNAIHTIESRLSNLVGGIIQDLEQFSSYTATPVPAEQQPAPIATQPIPVVAAPAMHAIHPADYGLGFAAAQQPTTSPVDKEKSGALIVKITGFLKKKRSVDTVAAATEIQKATKAAAPTPKALKKSKKKMTPVRLAIRLAVVGALGFYARQYYVQHLGPTDEQGVVAAAETSVTETKADSFAESFVDLPFAETEWAELVDPDMGVTVSWPKNTSNLSRVVGGSNLWFIRKGSYLMKISIASPNAVGLNDWWADAKTRYTEQGTSSNSTIAGNTAIKLTPTATTETSGTTYFLEASVGIMSIWVKDELPTSDDGKRIARMISSLKIIPASN
jgi:hypothetical protein